MISATQLSNSNEIRDLEDQSKKAIQVGSKSFSLASKALPAGLMESAHLLYHWCRVCDDWVDLAPNAVEAKAQVDRIQLLTDRVVRGEKVGEPAFDSLGQVIRRYRISPQILNDMIDGFRFDALEGRIHNNDELLRYCYQVAGTVGLMMAPILGTSDPVAYNHAKELGMAMQLTNIARDITEDRSRGRQYWPEDWIKPENISSPDFSMIQVGHRLLTMAEGYYIRGFDGLQFLPWRSALAIAWAGICYRQIGQKILRSNRKFLETRIHVSTAEKFMLLPRAIWLVVRRKML